MHRTEADNLIVVGGLNKYTDGPPGTIVNAVDKNTIQEELAYLIETNGLALKTVATETNTQVYEAIAAQIAASAAAFVDWDAKNLLIDVASNTEVTVTADRLSVLNSSYVPSFLNNLSTTFDITSDLMAGTAEKASTWYQLWIDSAGGRLMVPDVEGTADGTTANYLDDSAHTLKTDGAKAGDILYNTTDFTQTTLAEDPTADGADILLSDDIMATGETWKIHMLSPVGLGASKANIGAVYNDSGSDLTIAIKNGHHRITTARYQTSNGYGSSSSMIRKWSVEVEESNNVVVAIKNDAALGCTITANMDCILHATWNFVTSLPSAQCGFSKNSTQLTTQLSSVTQTDVLVLSNDTSANVPTSVTCHTRLTAGDIVRPHGSSGAAGSNTSLDKLMVVAVET